MSTCGPFEHTMFLGCSVIDFSSRLGWNEQSSQLTINLVQDTCDPTWTKYYYNQTTLQKAVWSAPDPGFSAQVGQPYYFRFGDFFDYAGILQSYTKNFDENGRPTYSVTLTDPREILDGCQVILNDYVGSVGNMPNIFNAYAFAEHFGKNCPEACLPDNTGPCAFGGSRKSEAGVPWWVIKSSLSTLTSAIPKCTLIYPKSANWSRYGRIVYHGVEYLLDLSEVLSSSYYRIPDKNMSIGDLIRQVTSDSAMDYYCELLFFYTGNIKYNLIKIRTVSRALVPNLNAIDTFLASNDASGSVAASVGRELRSEAQNKMLIGGPKEQILQVISEGQEETATIWPFWGYDSEGLAIIGRGWDDEHNFDIDISHLNLGIDNYNITVRELKIALGGQDQWISDIAFFKPNVASQLGVTSTINIENFIKIAREEVENPNRGKPKVQPQDAINMNREALEMFSEFVTGAENEKIKKVDILWQLVNTYATEYYAKKFMVQLVDSINGVPAGCVRLDAENNRFEFNQIPTDAGWVPLDETVLSVSNINDLETMRQEDGRIQAFVKFGGEGFPNREPEKLDLSELTTEEAFVDQNGFVCVKCSVESEFVFLNYNDPTTARALITLAAPVKFRKDNTVKAPEYANHFIKQTTRHLEGEGGNLEQIRTKALDLLKMVGSSLIHAIEEETRLMPNGVALPLQSTIQRYGPWGQAVSLSGKAVLEYNDDLVPWNYGSDEALAIAAGVIIRDGLSRMIEGEFGSIRVPGLPTLRLGVELISDIRTIDPNKPLDNGTADVEGNALHYAQHNAQIWNGIYGPNVTGIDISVGEEGVTTSYQLRTFTPAFGVPSKQLLDRIKTIGTRDRKIAHRLRLLNRPKSFFLLGARNRAQELLVRNTRLVGVLPKSPHNLIIGQRHTYSDGEITYANDYVQTQKLDEARTEIATNYGEKYVLSLEALFSPYETSGFATGMGRFTKKVAPPALAQNYNLMPINAKTLNPLLNPNDASPTFPIAFNRKGHSSKYVARGEEVPNDLEILQSEDYPSSQNYRSIALKGPLVLSSWGYDVNGKPVPNVTEDEGGNPKDLFAKNWLRRPQLWKTGPIDLRWDEQRGVWTCFPGFNIVKLKLCTDISPYGFALANIIDGVIRYNHQGINVALGCCPTAQISNGMCNVYNPHARPEWSGHEVIAHYDETSGYYIILSVDEAIYEVRCNEGNSSSTAPILGTLLKKNGALIQSEGCFNLQQQVIMLNPLEKWVCVDDKVLTWAITNTYHIIIDAPDSITVKSEYTGEVFGGVSKINFGECFRVYEADGCGEIDVSYGDSYRLDYIRDISVSGGGLCIHRETLYFPTCPIGSTGTTAILGQSVSGVCDLQCVTGDIRANYFAPFTLVRVGSYQGCMPLHDSDAESAEYNYVI